MPLWVRGWDFIAHSQAIREVGGSNPGCGTIVGWVLHSKRQPVKISPTNMPSIVNGKLSRFSLRGEVVNYRPFASPSVDVASHVK